MRASISAVQEQRCVSIILIAFNDKQHLPDCLNSLLRQNNAEVIVVDNASNDGSSELIETHYPQVKLIRAGTNLGFGGGNNLGAQAAQGNYLVFLNSDTIVDENWLNPLVETLERDTSIGLVTAKLLLMSDPQRINTCGNDVHFTGFGYLRAYQQPSDTYTNDEEVCSVSGAAFAVRKDLFLSLGGFDEGFFPAYVEDTDLSWRTRLAGYRNVAVADSRVLHDYKTGFSPQKYHWLERNRWQLILKTYRLPTLALLLPALLLSEIVTWGFATLKGGSYLRTKLQVYGWLLQNMGAIRRSRKKLQQSRVTSDRDLLKWCTPRLNFAQISSGVSGSMANVLFNPLYNLWYRFMLIVIRW